MDIAPRSFPARRTPARPITVNSFRRSSLTALFPLRRFSDRFAPVESIDIEVSMSILFLFGIDIGIDDTFEVGIDIEYRRYFLEVSITTVNGVTASGEERSTLLNDTSDKAAKCQLPTLPTRQKSEDDDYLLNIGPCQTGSSYFAHALCHLFTVVLFCLLLLYFLY